MSAMQTHEQLAPVLQKPIYVFAYRHQFHLSHVRTSQLNASSCWTPNSTEPPAAAKGILSIRITGIDSVLTVAQLPIYIG